MAVAASFDDTLRYGAQTPFTDQLSYRWEGGMWEYDAHHSSIITAGNGGTKPTQAGFTLFYNQGAERYDLEQTLQPDEQMWIDVGKLIREHVPDKNGKTLPADLSSGSFEVRDLIDTGIGSLFEGKLIYDKTYGHVTYGCSLCCGYQKPGFFGFNPLGIPLSGDSQNEVWSYDACLDVNIEVTNWFYPNWSTLNTAIATVNTSGGHHGVSVGSTGTNTWGNLATQTYRYCPVALFAPPTAGATVRKPHHLKVLSDTYAASSACPTTARRLIEYQEVDINNAPVGTIQSKELFGNISTNTCKNGNPSTSSTCSTDDNGVFTDALSINCNSVGGSCGMTLTKQQWLWCPANGATPVVIATPGDIILHNDSISVGGNTAGFAAGTYIYP